MTYPRSPREGAAPVTVPLNDLALTDRESIFHAPRAGDVALLGVLVAVLLGNGVWIWRQLGVHSQAGRAIFFGLLLLCVYWCAVVYVFKLSLSARIGPRSIAVTRGPWRVEIRWSELGRLMERIQPLDGRRYRWVIAVAHDGRRISVREDAILNYARFRREAYERYTLWRDHGGTWGATGTGPFTAREVVREEAQWWAMAAAMIALPGLYFALLLPETDPLGYALLALALGCLALMARVFLQRQTYSIERRYIETRSSLRRARLTWGEVARVERIRHPVSNVILSGVALGRLALRLAARGDTGIRTFAWSPRVPEYLVLRGGGRQARIRLHRLMQPDELLAWVEFYDQASRWSSAASGASGASAASARPAETAPRAATGAPASRPSGPLTDRLTGRPSGSLAGSQTGPVSGPLTTQTDAPDLSGASGPLDPWGGGRAGEPGSAQPTAPFGGRITARMLPDLPPMVDEPPARPAAGVGADQEDAWLRETSALISMGDGGETHTPESFDSPASWRSQREPQPEPRRAAPQWEREEQREQRAATGRPVAPQPGWQPATDAGWRVEQYGQPAEGVYTDARDARDARDAGATGGDEYEEEEPSAEINEIDAPPTPWRDAGWQPPILPRFGPTGSGQSPRSDDPPRERR